MLDVRVDWSCVRWASSLERCSWVEVRAWCWEWRAGRAAEF